MSNFCIGSACHPSYWLENPPTLTTLPETMPNLNKENLSTLFSTKKFNNIKNELKRERSINKKRRQTIRRLKKNELHSLLTNKTDLNNTIYGDLPHYIPHDNINKRYLQKLYNSENSTKSKKINNILKNRPSISNRKDMWNKLRKKYPNFFKKYPNFLEEYLKNISNENIKRASKLADNKKKKKEEKEEKRRKKIQSLHKELYSSHNYNILHYYNLLDRIGTFLK